MKIYDVCYKRSDTFTEKDVFYSLAEAKRWMKERPGSKGFITKIYSNGDWEPCGEIVLDGKNSVQMSNQTTRTY